MARSTLTTKAVERLKPPMRGRREVWDAALPGFGVRISESGRRSWILVVRFQGNPIRLTLGKAFPATGLAEARELAREAIHEIARGEDPRKRKRGPGPRDETIATLAESYLSRHEARARWRRETERILRKDVLPVLGARRPREITRRELLELLDAIADRAPVMANRTAAVVSRLFSWMLDRELIDSSPAVRLLRPSRESKRERVLAEKEIRELWPVWEEMGRPFGRLFQFLLTTAQRRGEAAAARWTDVDLAGAIWRVPRTKAGHANEVPLSPLAVEILTSVPRMAETDHVFPGRTGGVSGFSKAASRARSRSGIEGWTWHDLRRTAATGMAELGVPKLTVSRVLNHAEGGVTSTYVRAGFLREKRDALETWASRLRDIVTQKPATGGDL